MSGAVANARFPTRPAVDGWLLLPALSLLVLGLVMVASASIAVGDQKGQPFYFLMRQGAYALIGVAAAVGIVRIPMSVWQKHGAKFFLLGLLLLALVLIPGIGKMANGSRRWLMMGPLQLQVSEIMKLLLVVYLAGFLVRHGEELRRSATALLRPASLLVLLGILLILEPDYGALAMAAAIAFGLLFIGGAPLWPFGGLMGVGLAALVALALSSPYRLERLTVFLNPWADPFASGFQLTQALIAFGRGEWWGVGLGASVQKLFYLPEAHTDFLFAVLAEELGVVGALSVIALFAVIALRAFSLGRRAMLSGASFAAYCAYGLGLWMALQAVINMGVNMGMLPTKGLTLPLMSYGGSSMVASCGGVALLLRIHYETRRGKIWAQNE